MSLLTPLDPGLKPSYWRAPPSASHVEFVIVLGDLSDVSGVILLVSPCGYSMADAPTVSGLILIQLLVLKRMKTFDINAYIRTLKLLLCIMLCKLQKFDKFFFKINNFRMLFCFINAMFQVVLYTKYFYYFLQNLVNF